MRKLLIASVLVSLCVADFGAFAATTGRSSARTTANTQNNATTANAENGSATYRSSVASVRSAVRSAVAKGATTQNTTTKVTTKTTPVQKASATAPTVPTAATARAAKKPVARAATQKVINMGTKVAGATENTVVSQECQDAYYGCMDAFCMLDNTSGGRCQCSDRNADLDLVLEEIMALDEQSYAMATEGVERLQMGESADEIMARAKAVADGVINSDKKTLGASNKTKVRQLDLNAWKNNDLFAEEDDIFAGLDSVQTVQNDLANKTGDALQKAAADLCAKQIPAQCAKSTSFLQLTYAQKIKSDCSAYENSLKQQRNASAEKLQTAQKALRDAALEAYQNENKYDFGQCVVRFKQCLQTTAECGDDYSGCVADTAILDTLYNKKNSNKGVATTTIKTGATSIKISSATYDILNTKKIMCESVTKQCVNANKKGEVWQQVLKDLAPVVYTAEYNAASNNRMNCISTVVSCVQKSCGSQWDEQTDNFDACLSDPNSIENYCKLEYQRCGADDASGSVREYVMAKLSALKVDKCTQDVKACLTSDNNCGADFSGCVGLDTDSIVNLCDYRLLVSCQDEDRDEDDVREYIAQIAQGIALNFDNKMATTCQNAVDAAFARVCGEIDDGSVCATLDTKFASLNNLLASTFVDANNKLYDSLEQYVQTEGLSIDNGDLNKIFGLKASIRGQDYFSNIKFDKNGYGGLRQNEQPMQTDKYFYVDGVTDKDPDIRTDVNMLLGEMSNKYSEVINQIESDITVDRCMNGRDVRGFKDNKEAEDKYIANRKEGGLFSNLTDFVKSQIAAQLINAVMSEYEKVDGSRSNLYEEMLDYYNSKIDVKEAELDKVNEQICSTYNYAADFSKRGGHKTTSRVTATYVPEENYCAVKKENFSCYDYKNWQGCKAGKWRSDGVSNSNITMSYIDSDGKLVKKP